MLTHAQTIFSASLYALLKHSIEQTTRMVQRSTFLLIIKGRAGSEVDEIEFITTGGVICGPFGGGGKTYNTKNKKTQKY